MAHLKAMESFEFVYCLVALQRTLLYFREPAVQLQSHSSDIASAVALVTQTLKEVKSLRSSDGQLASYSGRVFQHASRIAEQSNIEISTPRIGQRQQHRLNLPIDSPQKYFEVAVLVPFLDHLISQMETRYQPHVQKASLLQGLLPRSISNMSSIASVNEGIALYAGDSLIVDEEYSR